MGDDITDPIAAHVYQSSLELRLLRAHRGP
jgi:hypothetical protein